MTKKYKGFRLAEKLIDSYKLLSDEELEKEADRLMFLVDKYGEFSEFATQHTNAEAEIIRRREDQNERAPSNKGRGKTNGNQR